MKNFNNFLTQQITVHSIMKPVLILAKCIGVFPVSGLLSKSPCKLKFRIKSPYTLIILLGFAGSSSLAILSLINMSESGASPRIFQKFITNASGPICFFMILRLARCWPNAVQEVTLIENSLPKFNQKNISLTCHIAAALIFSCAILEYVLSVKFYSRLTEACPLGNSRMESYYIYTLPSAAQRIPFTVYGFLLTQVILVQIIMVSNFADVLIIVISLYLSAYFEELNNLVNQYGHKSPNIWNVLRVRYTKLTHLVKIIDNCISPFIVFSFGINMIMICVQLFKILRKDLAHATGDNCDGKKLQEALESVDRSLYFNFSIVFLIGRTVFTALIATRVHSSARAPLYTLYEVPACCYTAEVRRFVEQIQANTIALSGLDFFYVTRNMILTMIGTVFTYELVLLQFSNKSSDTSNSPN